MSSVLGWFRGCPGVAADPVKLTLKCRNFCSFSVRYIELHCLFSQAALAGRFYDNHRGQFSFTVDERWGRSSLCPECHLPGPQLQGGAQTHTSSGCRAPQYPSLPGSPLPGHNCAENRAWRGSSWMTPRDDWRKLEFWQPTGKELSGMKVKVVSLCAFVGCLVLWVRWGVLRGSEEALTCFLRSIQLDFYLIYLYLPWDDNKMKCFRWMFSSTKKEKENFSVKKKKLWTELKKEYLRAPNSILWVIQGGKQEKRKLSSQEPDSGLAFPGSYLLLSEVEARRTLPESPTTYPGCSVSLSNKAVSEFFTMTITSFCCK